VTTALDHPAPTSRARRPVLASWLLTALLVPACAYGLLAADAYTGASAQLALGSRAQDVLTLVLLPLLLVAAHRSRSGSLRAHLLLLGLLAYLAYSYAIYLVGWPQNRAFLLYCAVVTIATAALVDGLVRIDVLHLPGPLARLAVRWMRRAARKHITLFVTDVPGPPARCGWPVRGCSGPFPSPRSPPTCPSAWPPCPTRERWPSRRTSTPPSPASTSSCAGSSAASPTSRAEPDPRAHRGGSRTWRSSPLRGSRSVAPAPAVARTPTGPWRVECPSSRVRT
jgi:hypothetical protein